ncbi:MAG: glycerophosphodiester phosphodiesterase [Leptothrix sp. (in: Bacteria)]|nr:glycerophosphodiester phosphodiesterase [Leptothrix sp. (in: b-proteobacteria)]
MTAAWPLPLWIAHRGAGKLAPENTLAAFRLGASHGYRAFECDVKLSADGVPFLLHDATLNRTTPAHGVAGERPWSTLSRLDAGGWHSAAYAGEPLPSLEAIACYVQRNGFALNIEIKPTPGQAHATGVAVAAACTALWQAAAPALLFSSFEAEALRGARESAPALPRALLLDKLTPGWFELAQGLGCVAVVTQHRLMDAPVVARLHAAGLHALCYTVNDADEARRLLALGVDGLITDAVDRFAAEDGVVSG